MEFYYVGGCVRDQLLGLKPKDTDYLVVGSTPEDMIAAGFQQVGADFPVFLNPTTGDEYALARTERKNGKGYLGFDVDASPTVTLEEDLRRRDLTINAMAIDIKTGKLYDPYNGQRDLYDGIVRHVSEAFAEDPLRVLRAARFAARYGFQVAPQTTALMAEVAPELNAVSRERIVTEMYKILSGPNINVAYNALRAANVFNVSCMKPYDTERFDWVRTMGDDGFNNLSPEERFAVVSERFGPEDLKSAQIPKHDAMLSQMLNSTVGLFTRYDSTNAEHKIALFNYLRAFSTPMWFNSCIRVLVAAKLISQPTSYRATLDLKRAKAVDVSDAPNKATGAAIRELVDDMRAAVL